MALIIKTIQANEQSPEVTEIQKALLKLGATISSGELFTATTAGTLGTTTQAALADIRLRFGLSQTGQPSFDAPLGRLLNIAVGAEIGHSAGLRQAVRETFAAIQIAPAATPAELAWLARYATIARDFTTARAAIDLIPDERSVPARIKHEIAAIVRPNHTRESNPEILNPENYYTVKYGYVPKSAIDAVIEEP